MAFENLMDVLAGGSRLSPTIGAEKGTVRNLIANLAGLMSPQAPAGEPLNITPNVAASPMGKVVGENMAAYTPGDIGDPAAADLEPFQKAFLNATATGESRGRYDVRYTPSGGARFTDFEKHPGIFEPGPEGKSSAAGRYQFTKTTWDSLGGGPFDPVTQDIRGWQLAERDYRVNTGRDLSDDLKSKGFTPEIAKALSSTWTSFRDPSVVKQAQMVFDKSMQRYGTKQVAGDVVPFPETNRPYLDRPPQDDMERLTGRPSNTGPTNKSADYGWGNRTDPNVTSIGKGTMTDWLSRTGERLRRGGGNMVPLPIQRPGVGPDAAPGPGGPKLPPLTQAPDSTPDQHKNFVSLIEASPVRDQIAEVLKDRWALNPQSWEREQNQMAWPDKIEEYFKRYYKDDKYLKILNEAGIVRLKKYMLDRLGVDTLDGFEKYNDTATPSEQERQGSIFKRLKRIENEFIYNQNLDGLLREEKLKPSPLKRRT